ncbi:unnamed protein product [Discosporangium mesarthrocarpum]
MRKRGRWVGKHPGLLLIGPWVGGELSVSVAAFAVAPTSTRHLGPPAASTSLDASQGRAVDPLGHWRGSKGRQGLRRDNKSSGGHRGELIEASWWRAGHGMGASSPPHVIRQSGDSWLDALQEASGGSSLPLGPKKMAGLGGSDPKDIRVEHNNALKEWLGEQGVWVFDRSDWGVAPHPLSVAVDTVDENENETAGRGMISNREIKEGDELFSMPVELLLTKARAKEVASCIS